MIPIVSSADIRFVGCFASTSDYITAQTFRNDVVQIYSNSWAFFGEGDTVSSPGAFWNMALQEAMTVHVYYM